MQAHAKRRGGLIGLLATLVLASGCSAPLSVQRLTLSQSYRQLNQSALSSNSLSDFTQIVLRRNDLSEMWSNRPDAAIAGLRADVVGHQDRWSDLFALAEMSYLTAKRHGSSEDLWAAAVYSYAFLEPGDASVERPSPYDERFRQACDIYNLALTAALSTDTGSVLLTAGRRSLPFGSINLSVDPAGMLWNGRPFANFEPTATLAVTGLQNIYRSPGLGVPMAARAQPVAASSIGFQVAPKLSVPTNLLLVIDNPRQQVAQGEIAGTLKVHSVSDDSSARLGQEQVPLEYDQTAARALSLADNAAWSNEYSGFLDGTFFERAKPQLVAIEPHRAGRMPVILIHGTASSAFRWSDMVNDLLEDPQINEHFEFWAFSYATGNPIPYSALQLRRALEGAVAQLGGVAADPALGRITLIGHSQGGLLAKMLVIDPGDRLWAGLSDRPLSSLTLSNTSHQLLRDTLFPKPLPEVQRVIFIATPQRGSYVAAFSISRLVGRLVTLPLAVTEAGKEVLTGNGDNVVLGQGQLRLGSVYGMSPNSPFIRSLAAVPVAPAVHAHSIIPVSTRGPISDGNDGVVRYSSAHIQGVESELVVHSGHSTQSNPATIAEVRRILLLQLAASSGR